MAKDKTTWVCRDCATVQTIESLKEWRYGCAYGDCQRGWHHKPCADKPNHGAAWVVRGSKRY